MDYGIGDSDNRFKALHNDPAANDYDPGFYFESITMTSHDARCDAASKDQGRCLPQKTLGASIYAVNVPGWNLDMDADGLTDFFEDLLAEAFRPIFYNHSTEDATMAHAYRTADGRWVAEPVTIYQVRPHVDAAVAGPEIEIKFVKLWRRDVYDSVFCGGHEGDTQFHSIFLRTTPAGDANHAKRWWVYKTSGTNGGELTWSQGDGSVRGVHFESLARDETPAHEAIYLSKGKHHEYADTGWSGQADKNCPTITAGVNARGWRHDPPLPRRAAEVRAPAGSGDLFGYDNVGSSAHRFFDDLTAYGYAGKHVWSGAFYDPAVVKPIHEFLE